MSFTVRKNESDKIIITLLNIGFRSPRLEKISNHHRVRNDHGRTQTKRTTYSNSVVTYLNRVKV